MRSNLQTLLLVLLALGLAIATTSHLPWTPLRLTGALLGLPALILFVIARIQLGNSFSVKAQATQLVTTGLYAYIRNPIYLFGGLTLAGLLLFVDKPRFLLLFLILLPLQLRRIRNEEQVLTETFGDQYLQYKAKTWF